MALSSYEGKAREEVELFFRSPEDGVLSRVTRSLFKPVEVVAERLVPSAVLEAAGNGVEAVMRGIATLSDQTLDTGTILSEARKHCEVIDKVDDLRRQDLRVADAVAEVVTSQHQLAATLQGAGCGFGGAALLAADVPLLFGVCMRVVRQLGAAYGVDPHAPGEGVIALKVFELAAGGTRDRYAELLQLDALRDELDGLEPARRAEKAAVLAGLFMSKEGVRIVTMLLSRKLLQSVPIAGAAVGAGFNYLFVSDVAETARAVYRRRFLVDKERVTSPARA
jgi:hypothetical protein